MASIDKLDYQEVANICVALNTRKVSRTITRRFDEILQPSGLRATQFQLLVSIQNLDAPTITDMAEDQVMHRTTVTRNLKPLEKDGLITYGTGQDQRTRIITLTDRGLQLIAETLPLWEVAQAEFVNELGSERWRNLLSELRALINNLS